jgi:CRISPR-associated endoribonuclease Cas6
MRLQAFFDINTDWMVKDYRRIFMSLIKTGFHNYDPVLYANLYGTEYQKKKMTKPFTFSIHFPDYKEISGNKIICGSRVSVFFSSNSESLATAFHNGLKQSKRIEVGKTQPIIFSLSGIRLLPLKKISSDKVLFKTLSPVLVNEKGNNLMYIPPTHPAFDKEFRYIISNQAKNFNVPCEESELSIEISSMKKLPLTHYNQTMTSWLGEFTMEAPRNVLQLVYDTGIGVRRSQGFGMLEIQKTF